MKKKLLVLLAFILCLTPVFGLVACGDDVGLAYNVKYICDDDYIRSDDGYKQSYIVFDDNGHGRYHYYSDMLNDLFEDGCIFEYTIKFKYTYLDEDKSTVACFFDSITFGDHHTESGSDDYSDWSRIYTVSKNVVKGGDTFINKDYLDNEIKNYSNVVED